jgi:hypothetical protein
MSDWGNSLALSALCSFSAVHVAVKTRISNFAANIRRALGAVFQSKEALPAGRDRLSTTLRPANAASARLSVRLAAVALLLAASVAALLAADRLTGLFFGPVPWWPVLTPESSVRYKTVEFDIVAQANRFGFRGDESTTRTGQIVAIGDSYTFGWGNNLGDTWEKVLAPP